MRPIQAAIERSLPFGEKKGITLAVLPFSMMGKRAKRNEKTKIKNLGSVWEWRRAHSFDALH
jgi:hypothetical protein